MDLVEVPEPNWRSSSVKKGWCLIDHCYFEDCVNSFQAKRLNLRLTDKKFMILP